MGTIQSGIGLISGLNIGNIVDQLMALNAKPRDALTTRNDDLKKQQTANTELMALLYALKYVSDNLGKTDVFASTSVTSSNSGIISVKATGAPAVGDYQFTALRKAQNQQLLSSGLESLSDAVGAGKITFRFGNNVDHSINLSDLKGGTGFSPGKILITDRSGAQAEIDLSAARTMNDVLEAINSNASINVKADVAGDRIRLTAYTGQTVSNLKIQEVGAGTTAASLGLAGINVSADTALGQDVIYLARNLNLAALNDGLGIGVNTILPDIQYKLRDGTQGEIDLSEIQSGTSNVNKERTLGEIMDKINAAAPDKLRVEIAPDGERLIVSDLTAGAEAFQLSSINDSHALEDLGLTGAEVDGVITGSRLISGGKTVLLSSLGGGSGLGQLGAVNLTDRNGGSATVDLSSAETLEDVINAINASGVQITAQVNQARNGIELIDASGSTSGNLIVANGDAANTADKLQIAVNDAVNNVNSGDLHLQIIGLNTKLAELNGGAGVTRGKFRIFDSNGANGVVNLNDQSIQTVGDLLQAIHLLPVQVLAEINDTGDGIVIRDANGGPSTLKIEEYGSTTAGDLNLLGPAATVEINGQSTQVIDGAMTRSIELAEGDTLESLRDKINQSNAGVTAAIFSDGSNKPYRLLLTGNQTGRAGQLVLDTSQAAITFDETARAQDALLSMGNTGPSTTNILISSTTNSFTNVLNGATLNIEDVSSTPVTIKVATSNTDVVANIKTLVDNYNKFRGKLKDDTAYDTENNQGSVLTGDNAALQLDIDMSALISGSYSADTNIQSLAQIGINIQNDGTLSLDETKLNDYLANHRDDVKQFFTAKDTGLSARFARVIERLAAPDTSLLELRNQALQDTIDRNQKRIDDINVQLDNQKNRLLNQFYQMELVIAKMQNNLSALNSIQWMLVSDTSNNLFSNNSSQ